jgi:hypothetical protein
MEVKTIPEGPSSHLAESDRGDRNNRHVKRLDKAIILLDDHKAPAAQHNYYDRNAKRNGNAAEMFECVVRDR